MKLFKHNPHPVDMNDFLLGRNVVLGGRDFESEEKCYAEIFEKEQTPKGSTSISRIRKSVVEKLFSIEFSNLTF